MKQIPSRALIVVGAALALGIGGGIAIADIPSSTDGTITACMLKPGGTIRLINAEGGATCKKGEQKVEWSQQGVPGEDGTDITVNDLYYVQVDTPGNQDTPTRRTRSAFCDVGDTPLESDFEVSGLAGTPIDTMRTVSVLTGGPKHGKFLDLVTTTPMPDGTVVAVTVACLDAAPEHID